MITLISIAFCIGYLGIIFEHKINVNKSAIALLTGVLCWTIYITMSDVDAHLVEQQLGEHLGELSGILFFLLSAMTVVELIDAHNGFKTITDKIKTTNAIKLVWIIGLVTFFLSSVLDNLTTTIVIVSLLRKMILDQEQRLLLVGLTIIAANAGGAWSPIGDVTTTMLWMNNQITTFGIMKSLFLPSMICLLVAILYVGKNLKNQKLQISTLENEEIGVNINESKLVFYIGIGALLFVPIFKTITGLPPYMAILFGLSVIWIYTEIIHKNKDEENKEILSINAALTKIDAPSILFFLGILLSVAALQSAGILMHLAKWIESVIDSENIIVIFIGLLSAIIDNVPLVAAVQGMYDLDTYPQGHFFWNLLAYTCGTGGSILIIGSAAGVAAMGLEKIEFFWYVKRISLMALLGYFAGIAFYYLQASIFGR